MLALIFLLLSCFYVFGLAMNLILFDVVDKFLAMQLKTTLPRTTCFKMKRLIFWPFSMFVVYKRVCGMCILSSKSNLK